MHQVPKVLEGVLNISAGQYHFDTQVIDEDEKTILGEANAPPGRTGQEDHSGSEEVNTQRKLNDQPAETVANRNLHLVAVGDGESALSGFDDSSTTMINSTSGHAIDHEEDNATTAKDASFAGHMISLDDVITRAGTSDSLLSSGGQRDYLQNDNAVHDVEDHRDDGMPNSRHRVDVDDEDEEEDDLTTPKKQQPSPITSRLTKLKRAIKNLHTSDSFPTAVRCGDDRTIGLLQDVGTGLSDMSHATSTSTSGDMDGAVFHRPMIRDLSMELFRSPDTGNRAVRRTDGGGG